jgi:signal peptidase
MTETDESARSGRNRRLLRRVGRLVGVVLLLVIVIPFVIYAVPQVVGADDSYVVLSGSMEPTMSPGDVIVIEDVPASEIEEGDIITFTNAGGTSPTTHRVIEVIEGSEGVEFRTAGDNSESVDQRPVSPTEVEGRVPTVAGYPFVVPWIGYVIQFASTQTGFASLIAVPIGLLIVSEVWSMSRRMRSGGADPDDTEDDVTTESVEQSLQRASKVYESGRSDSDTDSVISSDYPPLHVDLVTVSNGYGASESADSGPEDTGVQIESSRSETSTGEISAEDEFEEGAVSFTAPELELGLAILLVFLVYSVWVAIETVEIWAFTVAGSVGAAFLLLSALYVAGRVGEDSESEETAETVVESDEIDSAVLHRKLAAARAAGQALSTVVAGDFEAEIEVSPAPSDGGLSADGDSRAKECVSDD